MTTAREHMKVLSGLAGDHAAREHFLAITQGTGMGVDRIIFASQMAVSIEDDQLSVIQRRGEREVDGTPPETTATPSDQPNCITAYARAARVDVVERLPSVTVANKRTISIYVRTPPNKVSARHKHTITSI